MNIELFTAKLLQLPTSRGQRGGVNKTHGGWGVCLGSLKAVKNKCPTTIILEKSQKTASGMEAASSGHRDALRLPVPQVAYKCLRVGSMPLLFIILSHHQA